MVTMVPRISGHHFMSSPELRIVGASISWIILIVTLAEPFCWLSRFYCGASISACLDKSRAAIFASLVNSHAAAASFWCLMGRNGVKLPKPDGSAGSLLFLFPYVGLCQVRGPVLRTQEDLHSELFRVVLRANSVFGLSLMVSWRSIELVDNIELLSMW